AVKYADAKKPNSFIRIETGVNDAGVLFSISDNGIGIAPENITRIFDIFFRATSEASGTGLGLHIVKDTVERLSGTIEVQSQLGVGTQFRIYLPNLIFSGSQAVLSTDGKKASS
ncbi:MAG TPA: HAMP domain-containing sensor histidine kinase, partial [Cyclobacteriaceae bacterium]|nr:HAMP domain-containing sensor histidine kinase [Cyclobacteriaceae bacterium]